MAVLALQRTALHEEHKADARTVNGAEGVEGMNASFHPSLRPFLYLHRSVEGTVNDIKLLLTCQLNKVNRITGNANRQLRILLRMLHGVNKLCTVENVNIQMMSLISHISIQQCNEICDAGFLLHGPNALGTIENVLEMPSKHMLIWDFRYGSQ